MNHKNVITTTTILSVFLASSSALAVSQGDILARARIINIAPDVGSNQVMAGGAPLAPPAGIDVDDKTTLDIDFTYMVTNNFGVELLLDISSKHDIKGTGNLEGVNIGDVVVLPPALVAQWHFMPNNNVRPYAGAGINYTMFFSESTTDQFTSTMNAVVGGVTSTDVSVDNTFGWVVQAGVDIDINKDWYFNVDAKYIDMNTTATVQLNGADAATVDFDLNPLVLGVGVGTRF